MAAILEVRDVRKAYGAATVLEGVTFSVAKGDVVGVSGRSGSGKSTLVRLVAGLDRPDAGSIRLAGRDVGALDDEEASRLRLHAVGLVFQAYNLLPDLTVLQNVRLPLQLAGQPRGAADARAQALMRTLDVERHAAKKPHALSGGEQQRVAIARALANGPELLIADEPTGSLDDANAERVLEAFEDVNRRLGTTLLIVSHDDVVLRRVPRVLRVEGGRVAWSTAPPRPAPP